MSHHRNNSVRDKATEVDLFRKKHIPQTEDGLLQKGRGLEIQHG